VLVTPFFWLDHRIRFRLPVFNELFQYWILRKLKKQYDDGHCVLVTFDHTTSILARGWNGKTIYYCNDDHMRSYGIPLLSPYFRFKERMLASASDLIIVTSDYLLARLREINPGTHLVKLGAPEIPESATVPYQQPDKIKVAWVGFGGKKNDVSTFNEILKKQNNIEFHVFGELDKEILDSFINNRNFIYHGIRKGTELFKMLSRCNVSIAPYSVKEVNKGGTPNKLWLYMATGLPVVVTNIENIRNWEFPGGFVYRSEDNTDFVDLIRLAYAENNETLSNQRKDFARANTWKARAEEMIKLLNENGPTHPTT